MPKLYHIIATEDGNGYNITIPENPNISAHCADEEQDKIIAEMQKATARAFAQN